MNFSENEKDRYARQMMLGEVGESGQEKLKKSHVLVVGAGGLGAPILLYLAAAGIGTIGIVDQDVVSLSNLQRQILYKTSEIDQSKVQIAKNRLHELNPEIEVNAYESWLTQENAEKIISNYDIVVVAVDNVGTRYLINDTCYHLKIPFIEAGVGGFSGILMTVIPDQTPCYRCVYPQIPIDEDQYKSKIVEAKGIIGMIPGIVGSLEALEVIKIILGIGLPVTNEMLIFNGLTMDFDHFKMSKNPNCPLCGHKDE